MRPELHRASHFQLAIIQRATRKNPAYMIEFTIIAMQNPIQFVNQAANK